MDTKPITEYNKEALKNINKLIELGALEQEPVQQVITHPNFYSLGCSIKTILSAIEQIGYNGDKQDLFICAGLAELAGKIMPLNEFQFLDELLLKEENRGKQTEFAPIDKH